MKKVAAWIATIILGPLVVNILWKAIENELPTVAGHLRNWIVPMVGTRVPLWVVVVLLIVAAFVVSLLARPRRARLTPIPPVPAVARRPRLPFVPDSQRNNWIPENTGMAITISGTITNNRPSELTLLKLRLDGTTQVGEMSIGVQLAPGQGVSKPASAIVLPVHRPLSIIARFNVTKMDVAPGATLRAEPIFLDNYRDEYFLGELELAYAGPVATSPDAPPTVASEPEFDTTDGDGVHKKLVKYILRGQQQLKASEVTRDGFPGTHLLVEYNVPGFPPRSTSTPHRDHANSFWRTWYLDWKNQPGGFGGAFGTGLSGEPPW